MTSKALIVLNPAARRLPRRERLDEACREMAERGWSIDIAVSEAPGDAIRIARDAAGSCAAVFACGGDGTVSEVAHGLLGTDAALGCIPGGTSNLWAAEHQMAGDPKAA